MATKTYAGRPTALFGSSPLCVSDHGWQIVTNARSESENRRVARPLRRLHRSLRFNDGAVLFFNERARQQSLSAWAEIPQGRIIPIQSWQQMRTFFPDRYFGELIFLVKEGV